MWTGARARHQIARVPPRFLPCLLAATVALPSHASGQAVATRRDTSFAATVARLSEPGGYFDTDNLVSNETSYLHVITRLERQGVRGGAYIGVGPDQNYAYLAAIRPEVAYLLDIRRDNALQHLLYRALFARSRNRMEYLCRWLGRRVPADVAAWTDRPLLDLLAWVDSTALDAASAERERRETLRVVEGFGVPLDARDRETILRFHGEFMRQGLGLRFSSIGRNNAADYPTLRRLLTERDLEGRMRSWLVREEDWRWLREMQARGRLIPVVGDLAGPRAMAAVAADVRERGLAVTALYTSNAEQYIWRDGTFAAFTANVLALPAAPGGVIIRSLFDRGRVAHPLAVPGHASVQLLQRLDDFTRAARGGGFASYRDLVTRDAR